MSKCEECTDGRYGDPSHGCSRECKNCNGTGIAPQPSATETPSVRRYRVSYQHGVIEEDGSPRSPMDSKPMVLASDFDALEKQRDELRTQLAAAQAQMAGLRKYLQHLGTCDLPSPSNRSPTDKCTCGLWVALSPATGDAK